MAQNLRPQPTSEAERIHALDALRGLAILGVLLAYTVWNLGSPPSESWSLADSIVAVGMDLLVDNKCFTIFAILFGVGIAQQWRRWEGAGHNPAPLHLRRMGFLLSIGLLHALLLRNGDILAPYALLGLALSAFRRLSNKTVIATAVFLIFAPYVFRGLALAAGLVWPERPGVVSGGYLAENFAWLRYWYMTNPFISWPQLLALMLAGFLAGRAGLIELIAKSRSLAGRIFLFALPLAFLTRLALAGLDTLWGGQVRSLVQNATFNLLFQISSWTLAAAYMGAIFFISQGRFASLLAPFRAIGRMAFTNYLLQAIIIVPICLAFGLFDQVTPMRGLLLAVAVAALQAVFSTWWLSRFQMGPLERVWRGVTYGFGQVVMRSERHPTASLP